MPLAGRERSCFTTARIVLGRPRYLERHVRRILRDARILGLAGLDETLCRRALVELAAAAFSKLEGIVRLEARASESGRITVTAIPRNLGAENSTWCAIRTDFHHPGPDRFRGAKIPNRPAVLLANEAARRAGVDESILFDRAGRLVEGARTNLLVVLEDGALATPPLARGGVAGIARELCCEHLPNLVECDIGYETLQRSRELIAINAVRGARAITQFDGSPIAGGEAGPVAKFLADLLSSIEE